MSGLILTTNQFFKIFKIHRILLHSDLQGTKLSSDSCGSFQRLAVCRSRPKVRLEPEQVRRDARSRPGVWKSFSAGISSPVRASGSAATFSLGGLSLGRFGGNFLESWLVAVSLLTSARINGWQLGPKSDDLETILWLLLSIQFFEKFSNAKMVCYATPSGLWRAVIYCGSW